MIVPANLSETSVRINAWFDKIPPDLYSWHELRKEIIKEYLALFSRYQVETKYVVLLTCAFLRKDLPAASIAISNNKPGFLLVTIAYSFIDIQTLKALSAADDTKCADDISYFDIPLGIAPGNKPQPECGLLIPTEPITEEVKKSNEDKISWYMQGMAQINASTAFNKPGVVYTMRHNLYYILEKLLGI